MRWTEEQQKVIDLRNRSILVSAAAGSGKTAVLVERIISKVTDRKNPIDIDKMLIMTFTRAAAGEMKERLSRALEEALYDDPENEHLQRQMTLVNAAQITTIDGFCAYVIKNYFHLIELDPGYRVADEGEIKLLKEDILDELLEEGYAEGGVDFTEFVETFSTGKSDENLKEIILKLYETAVSNPDPENWIRKCTFSGENREENVDKDQDWMHRMWTDVQEIINSAEELAENALNICLEPYGPDIYEEALQNDFSQLEILSKYAGQEEYEKVYQALWDFSFSRLSNKKSEADAALKDRVKTLREEEKALVKQLKEKFFPMPESEFVEVEKISEKPIETLGNYTLRFMEKFSAKKREKNLLDFSDMEHLTLEILRGDGNRSRAAYELSQRYDEVMVDEYQDSNYVQEIITSYVSGWSRQKKNIFMVGDVKQSIYRFRQAAPELFMEKYHTFTEEDSPEQKIDLHKNFRSRASVLSSVNYLFRQLMGEDLGGITYDENAALNAAAEFPEAEAPEFYDTEVMLVESDSEELSDSDISGNARELEALSIAHRIREIVGNEDIYDKNTGSYRKAGYGDIVILLRSFAGWGETFADVLSSSNIPVYSASQTGYFSAAEVVTLLNYLSITDNPRQDIPLAGVLRSPIGNLSSQELGEIRAEFPDVCLWDSIVGYAEQKGEIFSPSLQNKLQEFLEVFYEIRDMVSYTPVHKLILEILSRTGYELYAKAMPDGAQRSANLSMLVEKALEYEKTSYRGLFNFIRYIDKLQKYEVDFGEVNLSDAGEGSVNIMTIHKSKGLEFPIVFVAGMGKQFNMSDINSSLLVHPLLGIGMDAVLTEQRRTVPSVRKQVIRRQLQRETIGEELRILYVALTRAKEKLIITGTIAGLEKKIMSKAYLAERTTDLLPFGIRIGARTYWDLLLPALMGHRSMDVLLNRYGFIYERNKNRYYDEAEFHIHVSKIEELTIDEVERQTEREILKDRLLQWDSERVYNEEIRERLEEEFSYEYPYGFLSRVPVKVSVSELKKRNAPYKMGEEELTLTYEQEETEAFVPDFVKKKEPQTAEGAQRGTAYHKVMECLDFRKVSSAEEFRMQIDLLQKQNKLQPEEAESIRIADLQKFTESSLGQRIQAAASDERLRREQPFMIMSASEEILPEIEPGQKIIVQGVIDAYFYENEEIVLVDYKTDRVRPGQENILVQRYETQLYDYAEALRRVTGKNVKEIYIYSFALGKEIRM